MNCGQTSRTSIWSVFMVLCFISGFSACHRNTQNLDTARLSDVTGGEQPAPPLPSVYEYPGLIPLEGQRDPATDLVYEGEQISSERASELRNEGVDLSTLNPREDTDLWSNTLGQPLNPADDELGISSGESFEFTGFPSELSTTKNLRFGVRKEVDGTYRSFTFSVGRRVHDVMLRKALLRKLGYQIAPTAYLSRITLQFENMRQVEIFKSRLAEDTVADQARWIVEEPDPLTLVIQDVVAVDAQLTKYNLANGQISDRIVGGRRLLRSLLIPFALGSMGENVNLFSWVPGRVHDGHVVLNYDYAEDFNCAREDALWMMRRIFALTRQDFEEVAFSAGLPDGVARLLVEKLVSRRNALAKLFSLDVAPIGFNQRVSDGDRLTNGEVVGQDFAGHGERFSYGDPESPLSSKEVIAFLRAKTMSFALSNIVTFLNKYLPNTDITSQIMKHKMELVNQSIRNYMATGNIAEVPLGAYVIPVLGTNLILNRDVVIGSYMGIENKVSLADTIGVNVSTGAYIGFDGLPVDVAVSGGAQAFLRRTYTHLKPIASLKAAVRAPFQNIVVPFLQQNLANDLAALNEATLAALQPAERQEKIKKVMSAFKENMGIGESLIITDSIGGDISLQGGKSFYGVAVVNAGVGAGHVVIGRMHIQRVAEDTIVISDGKGNLSTVRLSAGVSAAFVPLLRLGVQVTKGTAKTEVIPLDIGGDERRNPKLLRSIAAIRNALSDGSIVSARAVTPGYTLEHRFDDSKFTAMFLFGRYAQINGALSVEVRDNASGASKTFYQRRLAERWGTDFQSFATDGINALLKDLGNVNLSINSPVSDPAGSVKGKSFLREFVYEGVVEPAADESDVSRINDGFFSMQYRWRGWSMGRGELDKVVGQINKRYSWEFYPQTVLGNTDSIQFYDINLRTLVNPEGLRSMVRKSAGDYTTIFAPYMAGRVFPRGGSCDYQSYTSTDEYCRAFSQFLWSKARYGGEWSRGNNAKAAAHLINAIGAVENILKPQDLIEVFGGEKNVFVVSRIDGFRAGDEAGDSAIIGNTFGRLGTMNPLGPINAVARKLSIPVSEMMATWIRDTL